MEQSWGVSVDRIRALALLAALLVNNLRRCRGVQSVTAATSPYVQTGEESSNSFEWGLWCGVGLFSKFSGVRGRTTMSFRFLIDRR
jgi:hypothetical protein